MLQLELENAVATLVNFNPHTEKNGKDDVPAAALRIRLNSTADVLAHFSPTLKTFLFNEKSIDLIGDMGLRDAHLEYPLKRDEEMFGASVSIDYGVLDKIELSDVRVKDFEITPVEGGSVILAFTVLCKPDAYKQVPQLYLLQKRGITINLDPAEEQPELEPA